jgi:hypothetical protein
MKYIAETLYPTDSPGCCQETLLLEHLQVGGMPICLGIISRDSNAYDPISHRQRQSHPNPHDTKPPTTKFGYENSHDEQRLEKRCLDWLYEKGTLLCTKRKSDSLLRQNFLQLLQTDDREHFAGFLLYGNRFFFFQRGNIHGYYFYQRIHSPQVKCLDADSHDQPFFTQHGLMDADIGLLLCSANLLSPYAKKDLANSLSPHNMYTGGDLRRHLWELHDNHPAKENAAIYFLVRG